MQFQAWLPTPGGRGLELLLVKIRPSEGKDPFLPLPTLESLKGPQTLGQVESTASLHS